MYMETNSVGFKVTDFIIIYRVFKHGTIRNVYHV